MAAPYQNYATGTFLSDLVTRPEFLSYLMQEVYERSAFIQSGIISRNPILDARAGATRVQVPFFYPLGMNTEEVIESNDDWGTSEAGYLTPNKIAGDSQIMTILHRGNAYAADDLSKLGTGTDPMGAIRSYLASDLNKKRTATLLAQLTGVFGSALAANVVDNGTTYISAPMVIAAKAKLGERGEALDSIAMHPNQAYYLQQLGMLTFSSPALQQGDAITWGAGGIGVTNTQVGNFAGLRVIIDSQLPYGTQEYTSYLFASGVVSEGVQQEMRIEQDRNILSKQDIISLDYHYGFHINGVSYTGTDNPTNAALATSGNWSLVYDNRLTPVVKLISGTALDPD